MRVAAGRLLVAGRDAGALAREHGTPLYVYDLRRVAEVARALQALSPARVCATGSGSPSRPSASRPCCVF